MTPAIVPTTISPSTFVPTVAGPVKWTEALVYAAADAGLFGDGDRYELIDGNLWYMPAPAPIHEGTIRKLVRALKQALVDPDDIDIETVAPVGLGVNDVPIPDITLIRRDENDYIDRHPGPDDIYLVIKVANSHPKRERTMKREQYAKFGIEEFWIIDLQASELVVYRDPVGADYQSVTVWQDASIALVRLPDIRINTHRLRSSIFNLNPTQ